MNDTEWLILLDRSPEKARAMIIEEYRNYVYAVVLSKLRGNAGPEETEDCVSDVFVEVLESISDYKAEGTLKAFIGTVAVRVALNRFKKIIRIKNKTAYIDDEDENILPSYEDTENTVQDNIFRKKLWETVDMLGEPDNRIIVYQYCYGFKINEIAGMLSMTPSAVQKRSIRARKRIRKILEKEDIFKEWAQ